MGLSCIPLGGKYSLLEAGSFGGWLATNNGKKWSITCQHCLPECDVGSSVLSRSSLEITAQLDTIIPYTKHCPKSWRSLCKLKAHKDEVDFLKEKYMELPDDDGVELYDRSKIKLVGPDLGILVAEAQHRSPILQRHTAKIVGSVKLLGTDIPDAWRGGCRTGMVPYRRTLRCTHESRNAQAMKMFSHPRLFLFLSFILLLSCLLLLTLHFFP